MYLSFNKNQNKTKIVFKYVFFFCEKLKINNNFVENLNLK